jgi:hypothetical protein
VPRMRETRDPNAARLDWPGVVSFTGMLSLFTFAVIEAPAFGWTSPLTLSLFTGSASMLAAFVLIELRTSRPMLDLSLFKYPRFVGVQLLPIATCYSYVVLLILLPLRFVGVQGLSEIDAGLLMLALSAPMLIVPFIAANLARLIPPGILSSVGLLIAAVGVFWLGRVSPGAGLSTLPPLVAALQVMPPMLVIGFGAAIPWGLMDGLSISVVPKERAGMAAGIFNTSKVANEGVALATVSAALGILMARSLDSATAGGQKLLPEIAQRVVAGDVANAAALLPELSKAALAESYFHAFQNLTGVLALVTASAAVTIFFLLGRRA